MDILRNIVDDNKFTPAVIAIAIEKGVVEIENPRLDAVEVRKIAHFLFFPAALPGCVVRRRPRS